MEKKTDSRRIHTLRPGDPGTGPVVYWMQRDQRVCANWALLHAQETAIGLERPLEVVFCLTPGFPGANIRHYGFMLNGLEETVRRLAVLNIPFHLLPGEPEEVLPGWIASRGAGMLVTDFNPLRMTLEWRLRVAERITIPFHEVDAHNIIPCRFISDKQEYSAFTLRKKVERLLPQFLHPIPAMKVHPVDNQAGDHPPIDWAVVKDSLAIDREVPEVTWLRAGEEEAEQAMERFLAMRLNGYAGDRNDPVKEGQSDLSPYLHFGQLSAQQLALEVQKSQADAGSKQAFLEELIVRRELSDNFCLFNPDYDRVRGFQSWARSTLGKHRDDPREYRYSMEEFEGGKTHDLLWNAAQKEMVTRGKMHGFMRMYWAKKILEWSPAPEDAMETAIFLNDRFSLDGRDPNGYAGIAWAIGGTHDRPWGERPVFGMIRFMNYAGCRRKFDVDRYIRSVLR